MEIPSNLTYFLECIYPEKNKLVGYVSKDAYLIIDDYARFMKSKETARRRVGYWRRTISENGCGASGLSLVQDGRNVKEVALGAYLAVFQKERLGRLAR